MAIQCRLYLLTLNRFCYEFIVDSIFLCMYSCTIKLYPNYGYFEDGSGMKGSMAINVNDLFNKFFNTQIFDHFLE